MREKAGIDMKLRNGSAVIEKAKKNRDHFM